MKKKHSTFGQCLYKKSILTKLILCVRSYKECFITFSVQHTDRFIRIPLAKVGDYLLNGLANVNQ